jgi:hypothetical protein
VEDPDFIPSTRGRARYRIPANAAPNFDFRAIVLSCLDKERAMPENAIAQAILDETKRLGAKFDRIEGRMSKIESVVAELDSRIRGWPDMHYLVAAAKAQLTQTREIKTDIADTKVKIDEIYQAMATDPEIKSLREEVARFRDQSLETEVRLGTIEGHVGIKNSVEPG